jgi:hypothetical protein
LLPLRQLRIDVGVQLGASGAAAPQPPPCPTPAGAARDALWDRSRSSLSIARLLVHEGRPEALLAAACCTAVETACRAALEHAGLGFDGDVNAALARLAAPAGLWSTVEAARGRQRLAATEQAVGWIAGLLRSGAPERPWGY